MDSVGYAPDALGRFTKRRDGGMFWWVPFEYYLRYTAIYMIYFLLLIIFWLVVVYLLSTEAYYRRWFRSI